jgi:hypothetical protein
MRGRPPILPKPEHLALQQTVSAAIKERCISQATLARLLDAEANHVNAALRQFRYPGLLLRVADWLGIEKAA